MNEEMILVPKGTLLDLIESAFYARALFEGGVDNWPYWGENFKDYITNRYNAYHKDNKESYKYSLEDMLEDNNFFLLAEESLEYYLREGMLKKERED